MKTLGIVLIVVGSVIMLGPLMLLIAKIIRIDPYIIFKSKEEKEADKRSYVIANFLRPLLYPLWGESWVFSKKYRDLME